MTICLDEPCVDDPVTRADETYWTDNNAAPPVLLIDEATQAITESVHRIRSDPLLHYHHLAAAGVALGDLFGALDQLTDLLIPPVSQCVDTDPGGVKRLERQLESLGATLRLAQQAAEGLRLTARGVGTELWPVGALLAEQGTFDSAGDPSHVGDWLLD